MNLEKTKTKRVKLRVFRSAKHISAQIIDHGRVLIGSNDFDLIGTKMDRAKSVGMKIAKLAHKRHITHVFFDRTKYKYHGRVKALAEGARANGLVF
jgi:large subunit ribosomal protein L18